MLFKLLKLIVELSVVQCIKYIININQLWVNLVTALDLLSLALVAGIGLGNKCVKTD